MNKKDKIRKERKIQNLNAKKKKQKKNGCPFLASVFQLYLLTRVHQLLFYVRT